MPALAADHPPLLTLVVAVLAPLLAEIPLGVRVPIVAMEVLLGILAGPHALGVIHPGEVLLLMQSRRSR